MAGSGDLLIPDDEEPVKGIRICFDTTQNERGKLEENYTTFKEMVEKGGYIAESNLEFPITFAQLIHYDVVFFACPDRSKVRQFEIKEITKYVKCGGAIEKRVQNSVAAPDRLVGPSGGHELWG